MFWTVVLEKTLYSPLECKEIEPVNLKRNQSWIFIGRTDGEAEAPILWRRTDSLEKTLRLGKIEGRRKREMVEWHYRLNGHEFEQGPRVGNGQESFSCCSPWGHRVGHDWATTLNWYSCTELEYEFNSKYNF